jgi:hypothetical protein
MTRYFAFSTEDRTYFRATKAGVYLSGKFDTYDRVGFSSKPPSLGTFPAREIDKAEFDRLLAAKKQRTAGNSPQDSWVPNEEAAA